MALRRQQAFRGSKEYAASKRRNAAITLQRAARSRATVSRRNIGFPMPMPSTAPQGKLEVKSVQYVRADRNTLCLAVPYHMNNVTQGAGNNQRLGNKYRLTGVMIKGQAFSDAMTGDEDDSIVGYYLVWDRQPNQALAVATDIWTVDAANGLYVHNTGLKVGGRERFKIVGSWRSIIGKKDTNLPRNADINCFHKLPRSCITTQIAGDANGTIDKIVNGALLCVPYGNKETGPTCALRLAAQLFFEEA